MARYRLSAAAQADLVSILAWIHGRFGEAARKRYVALVVAALRDISTQPDRTGSIARQELGQGVRSWRLHMSREHGRTQAGVVRRPRHFLIYRVENGLVVIARVLHDAMDLEQQLDAEELWE